MTLYDYRGEYAELYSKMGSDEDIEALMDELRMLDESFDDKVHNTCGYIKSIQAEADALKAEEQRLADRRKALENNATRVKQLLFDSMKAAGRQEIKTDLFTARIQANPPALQLPDNFDASKSLFAECEIVWKLDKKAMIERLKSGGDAEGATLTRGESLRIR